MNKILVTGGAGFIGTAVIRYILENTDAKVLNLDKLTYAGNLDSLRAYESHANYSFAQIDICDKSSVKDIFETFRPTVVMHLAAESHVDRSIDGPSEFIQTNIIGTYTLLEVSRAYWSTLSEDDEFRFHHISTDEVYGDLDGPNDYFTESTAYAPSSPYSASKASSDHLVRAWLRTYGLPTLVTNCSNNYGPYQFPEKLIPITILNALNGRPLSIYGDGTQVRDWLYVDDHARALYQVALEGEIGETYNIGGHNEKQNIEVVNTICAILEDLAANMKPRGINKYIDLITYVADRPGHDTRYAIDAKKIADSLGWKPQETFESGIRKTVQWYLDNQDWCNRIFDGTYMPGHLKSHEVFS